LAGLTVVGQERNATFMEKVFMSRIPKTYKYVDVVEHSLSLIRPEAIKVFGQFYEYGGYLYDSWEAAEQFVMLRRAGWKIVYDGRLSKKCIHLVREDRRRLADRKGSYRGDNLIRVQLKMMRYHFIAFPKRTLHEMIKAGDYKLALKITYWLTLPYVVLFALASHLWWALLYALPPIIIYAYETNGLTMKFITPLVQIFRWVLVAHGYAFLLLRKLASNLRSLM
jgi:hypothetical protein